MGNPPVLKVAINVPLSRLFDYLPPAEGRCPAPGTRVRVPFGRQRQVGLVVAHASGSSLPRSRIRRVLEILDDTPLLREQDLWLIGFTSDYYHHPVGEVAAAAMPALLRQGRPLNPLMRPVAATDAAPSSWVAAPGATRSTNAHAAARGPRARHAGARHRRRGASIERRAYVSPFRTTI